MSNFQFGKSKVAKTAKSIRDDERRAADICRHCEEQKNHLTA